MTEPDRRHVAARRVLLDALEAAAAYRRSLIVVGAQAVYLRTERATLAAYTTDGDIVIDPSRLPSEPALEATLHAAGFTPSVQPDSWTTTVMVGGHAKAKGRAALCLGFTGDLVNDHLAMAQVTASAA